MRANVGQRNLLGLCVVLATLTFGGTLQAGWNAYIFRGQDLGRPDSGMQFLFNFMDRFGLATPPCEKQLTFALGMPNTFFGRAGHFVSTGQVELAGVPIHVYRRKVTVDAENRIEAFAILNHKLDWLVALANAYSDTPDSFSRQSTEVVLAFAGRAKDANINAEKYAMTLALFKERMQQESFHQLGEHQQGLVDCFVRNVRTMDINDSWCIWCDTPENIADMAMEYLTGSNDQCTQASTTTFDDEPTEGLGLIDS